MPYIPGQDRANSALRAEIAKYFSQNNNAGSLNYLLTTTVNLWIQQQLGKKDGMYTLLSSAIAQLECAKLEFYRRMVAPYENLKRNQHGDVFPCS